MIDHLVYATPDLAATVRELSGRLGVELSPGGQHLGMGTRNALADLGGHRYLEVVGPDPEQAGHKGPFFFDVDTIDRPRLVTWAVAVADLDATRERAARGGHELPAPRDMAREADDGTAVTWRMTAPLADADFAGLVPFVIEWGNGVTHPSERAAHGLRLQSLVAHTPQPDGLRARLALLGEDLPVVQGDRAQLRAVLDSPAGAVLLE